MTTRNWSDIRAQRFTPEELEQIDREVASELVEVEGSVPRSGPPNHDSSSHESARHLRKGKGGSQQRTSL